MRVLRVLLLLAAFCRPAAAQMLVGAEVSPGGFAGGDEPVLDTLSEEAFAWALTVEVSSQTLYKVFASTAPEEAATGWLRKGLYRQELTALLLLSDEKGLSFAQLAKELESKGLEATARSHGADPAALFAEAGRLKSAVDRRVPLFMRWSAPAASTAAVSVPAVSTAQPAAVLTR